MCYSYLKKKKQRSQICPHHQVATDFACVYHLLADCSDSDKSIEKYSLEEFSIIMGQFFRRLSLYNLDNKCSMFGSRTMLTLRSLPTETVLKKFGPFRRNWRKIDHCKQGCYVE